MDEWPALPYEEWRDTKDTLHMYTQIVGKLRLALSPFEPEWANVALYVSPRGLTTPAVPYGGRTFDAQFDFIDHQLIIRTSDGAVQRVALEGQAVADFYQQVMDALGSLGMPVDITLMPQEVPNPIPFPEDRRPRSYDRTAVRRFWEVLSRVDIVMKSYHAAFWGKTSPVHFFWGSFDLATTRYSGRPAEPPPGAGTLMRYAEDAEYVSAGFWPGDERTPYPAFYAYGYPRPDGCEQATVDPEEAGWLEEVGLFVFPYEAVRTSPDPADAIAQFLDTSYAVLVELMGWPEDFLHHPRPGG